MWDSLELGEGSETGRIERIALLSRTFIEPILETGGPAEGDVTRANLSGRPFTECPVQVARLQLVDDPRAVRQFFRLFVLLMLLLLLFSRVTFGLPFIKFDLINKQNKT